MSDAHDEQGHEPGVPSPPGGEGARPHPDGGSPWVPPSAGHLPRHSAQPPRPAEAAEGTQPRMTYPPPATQPLRSGPPLTMTSGSRGPGSQLSGPQMSGPPPYGPGAYPPGIRPPGPATMPMPTHAYGAQPPGGPAGGTARSGWLLPLVAMIALVVGLLGGALGGAAYDVLTRDGARSPSGSATGSVVDDEGDAPLPEGNTSVTRVAKRLLPSTVQVIASYQGETGGATGSGFVLDRRGHIVTNNHVVADSASSGDPIQIVDHDGNRYDAELVGRSPVYDLAVLYSADAVGLRPAALGSSERLQVGEVVVAIGSPLGLTSTVTSGIVSAVHRPVTTGDTSDDLSYINAVQTDAAINPGNSGGPLVNLQGQVVGVNSAIATTGATAGQSGNIGVGFAIPMEQVRVTARQILDDGEASYPVIGATVETSTSDGEGARVDEVPDGTPAASAGLEPDDLIVRIDGTKVTDGIALIVAIRSHLPGDIVELTLVRDGSQQTVQVTLDAKVG